MNRTRRVYDRAAGSYELSRRLWLRAAGTAAEARMIADLTELTAVLRQDARVLDAEIGRAHV